MGADIITLFDGYEIDVLDTWHPPMRWTAKWSNGGNIPLGLHLPAEMRRMIARDFYEAGLWLFSEEGHGELACAGTEADVGWTCQAYTRGHARYLFAHRNLQTTKD